MPTYEYRCKSCGYEFEELQSIKDKSLSICPKCTKPSLKRLLSSGAGLVFKGSGFYLTDYKKSNTSPTASERELNRKNKKRTAKQKPKHSPESKTAPDPGAKP